MIDCPKFSEARGILNNPSTTHRPLNEDNTEAICTFFRKINTYEKS